MTSLRAIALATIIVTGLAPSPHSATLFWDTDGSSTGNSAVTGANLGGAGPWSTTDANWWDSALGTLQPWTEGSDAILWGTAAPVTVGTVSANSLAVNTSGYSLN